MKTNEIVPFLGHDVVVADVPVDVKCDCYFTLENINIFEYTEFIYLEFGVVVWLFMHGIYNDGLLADFNVWKDTSS